MKTIIKTMSLFAAAASMLCTTGCVGVLSFFRPADHYITGDFATDSAVKAVEIDWTSGSVTVSHHDQPSVTATETCTTLLMEKQKMQTWLDGETLHIRYCTPGANFNMFTGKKTLEIKLPKGVELKTLKYDGTSADTDFTEISADHFDVMATSGNLHLDGCSADQFDIQSTSGDITVDQKGKSDTLKAESTSGDINITADTVKQLSVNSTSGDAEVHAKQADSVFAKCTSGNRVMHFGTVPSNAEIDVTSGNVTLYLPKNADFKAFVDQTSGKFTSDIPVSKDGDTYTAGKGTNQFKIDTTSGDIKIQAE